MHWNDRWEKLWHSIPIGAMPGEPIGLQSAVKLIIERKSGIGAAEDRSPVISFQPEFMNMWYGGRFMNMWHGGSKLQADLEKRSELARVEEIQTAARSWIKVHLRADKLRLFRDGGPIKLWVCESEFWQRVDPDDVFMQSSILDREGDKEGAYVLDATALRALLDVATPSAPKVTRNSGKVTNHSHKKGRPPAPYWSKAEKAAVGWLEDNGYPQPGDGGQAQLEKYVAEVLIADGHHPGESTVRERVSQWIAQYRQSVNA